MATPNLILFDDAQRAQLLPLVFTRPVCDLRVGILTIRQKWERRLGVSSSTLAEDYLSKKYAAKITADNLFINGSACPNEQLTDAIFELNLGQSLWQSDTLIAARVESAAVPNAQNDPSGIQYVEKITRISRP